MTAREHFRFQRRCHGRAYAALAMPALRLPDDMSSLVAKACGDPRGLVVFDVLYSDNTARLRLDSQLGLFLRLSR